MVMSENVTMRPRSRVDFVACSAVAAAVTGATPLAAREAEVATSAILVTAGVCQLRALRGYSRDAVQLAVPAQRQLKWFGGSSVPVHRVDEGNAPVGPVDLSRCQGQSERVLGGGEHGTAARAAQVDAFHRATPGVRPAEVVVLQVDGEHVGKLKTATFDQDLTTGTVHVAGLDAGSGTVPVGPVDLA